jgi:hypothetical protein
MKRIATIATAFAALLTITLTAQAHVQPADVAARCVSQVDQIVDRCTEVVADDTAECVIRIRRLLRAGRDEAAAAAARECHQNSRQTVRMCSGMIDDLCHECVRYLINVGATQLARRVYNHCEDAQESLQILLDRQQEILSDALNG